MSIEKKNKIGLAKKITIAVAAVSLMTVGIGSTISSFTDTATSAITMTSGNIDLKLGGSKLLPINLGTDLQKPGDTTTRTIIVTNSGSLPLNYTAAVTTPAPGALAAKINTTVTSVPASTFSPTGPLSTFTIPKQTVNSGATQTLTVTFTWPIGTPGSDNAVMNASGNTSILFSATQ